MSSICFANAPLGLDGLNINMKLSDVIKIKGEPTSKSEFADYITDIYKYPNLEVHFNGEDVVGMYTASENICTPEKVCIGSSLKNVQALYGKGHEKSNRIYEFYSKLAFTCWYRVSSTYGYVHSIEIACQP